MNKNGWGLRVELAFILLFLICLLISTIGLHKLGLLGNSNGIYTDGSGTIEDDVNYNYDNLEKKVSEAALNYYKDAYEDNREDTVIISTSRLIANGYLNGLEDNRGRSCKGYAIVIKSSNVSSYIKCGFYKTAGYNSDYE